MLSHPLYSPLFSTNENLINEYIWETHGEFTIHNSIHTYVKSNLKLATSRTNMSKLGLDLRYSFSRKVSWKPGKLPSMLRRERPSPVSNVGPRVYQPNAEEMRQVFNKFDANKDGRISMEEYKSAARTLLGKEARDSEMVKAFREVDSDGDGFIDFKEFTEMQNFGGGIKTSDIEGAFRMYDLDGDGRISAEELCDVMKRLGEKCSLESCRKMVREVDSDGDGCIDIDEFMKMMTRTLKPANC